MRPPSVPTVPTVAREPTTAPACRRCDGTREDLAIVREPGGLAFRIVPCPDCVGAHAA
jgi:hypothetical protein